MAIYHFIHTFALLSFSFFSSLTRRVLFVRHIVKFCNHHKQSKLVYVHTHTLFFHRSHCPSLFVCHFHTVFYSVRFQIIRIRHYTQTSRYARAHFSLSPLPFTLCVFHFCSELFLLLPPPPPPLLMLLVNCL